MPLADQDVAELAARHIDTPWAVHLHVDGPIPDSTITDKAPGVPLIRLTALKFAERIRETTAACRHLHGLEYFPVEPYVLHYGIVWTQR